MKSLYFSSFNWSTARSFMMESISRRISACYSPGLKFFWCICLSIQGDQAKIRAWGATGMTKPGQPKMIWKTGLCPFAMQCQTIIAGASGPFLQSRSPVILSARVHKSFTANEPDIALVTLKQRAQPLLPHPGPWSPIS